MRYITTPIRFREADGRLPGLTGMVGDAAAVIDNLVELIVFTPRGSFDADPDFGFEYWNYEFSNVHCREFNNEHTVASAASLGNEVTRRACQESVVHSLAAYAPQLGGVSVGIGIETVWSDGHVERYVSSKLRVTVRVEGVLENGLGTTDPYLKEVSFLMEPTVRGNVNQRMEHKVWTQI